jgi:xanthine dehydrogenase small subunit
VATVRFLLDGRPVTVEDPPATLTVLEYLRGTLRRTGTKEGCAEGDCGACTVVLGTPVADDPTRVAYRAINACIRFLATVDGLELVTVESLRAPDGTLHPVQQALVEAHASQCGFCTPGFVMSLFALYLQDPAPDRATVVAALSGNLCRCTGYRPIIAAGERMGSLPAPTHWSRAQARDPGRRAALDALRRDGALALPGFQAPRRLEALAAAVHANPDALILAGGTDIGLWVTKQLRELPPLIYLGEVAELQRITTGDGSLVIGAAVPLTDAWAAIVARHPGLAEVAARFGSPPVRNSGTLCGNLANGSPIGDALPILVALGATLELRAGASTRHVALDAFYLGYQRKDLARGEFVVAVRVPPPPRGAWVASYKLAKRVDQDISAVCGAFVIDVQAGRVATARIAYGGMAGIVARARAVEAALTGSVWNAASVETAAGQLGADYQPLGDHRASAAYRLQGAANLLRRFYLAHAPVTPGAAAAALRTGDAGAAA